MMAEGAFLHHSLGANGHIRVKASLKRSVPFGGIPVKILHGIGASLGAISASDATRIDLCHEALVIFIGGINRANEGAGRFITMEAGAGNKLHSHMGVFSFHPRKDLHPGDFPPPFTFLRGGNGNVILRFARHDARLASRAFI